MLKFDDYNIPDRTAQSLKEYIERGVPVGNFLHCVLSNDLLGAVRHADKFNKPAIQEIVRWIDAHAPDGCFGNEAKVIRWLDDHPSRKKGPKIT